MKTSSGTLIVGRSLLRQQQPISRQKYQGFTLVELVIVIVLLGIMATGITSFISLSTQTYINVADRDELIASARFAVERLNRELRNAVPNSIRIVANASIPVSDQCIEFMPIVASTTYLDIPVAPEPPSSTITVVPFVAADNVNDYTCGVVNYCSDFVAVYPITSDDLYGSPIDNVGKVFSLTNFTPPLSASSEWTLSFAGGAKTFDADSPTQRLYIINQPVSYCVSNGKLTRYNDYGIASPPSTDPTASGAGSSVLMANNLELIANSGLPFRYSAPSLQRNAVVQIKLHFNLNGEKIVFNQEVHIQNIP